MNGVTSGFKAPLAGVRFLAARPNLLRYFAVPVLINTVLYIAGGWLFFTQLASLLHWIFGDPATWYMQTLFYAAGIVIGAVFALVLIFTFTAVGLVVASPFLDTLSKKTDEIHLGFDPAPPGSVFKGAAAVLAGQLRKIVLFLLVQGACLLVYLIPVLGQIAGAPLQLVAAFFFLAWEFWDFPMDRRAMTYRAKRDFLMRHKFEALAFGAVCGLYMMVPLLNFVMLPASVAGATLLVSDLMKSESARSAT